MKIAENVQAITTAKAVLVDAAA